MLDHQKICDHSWTWTSEYDEDEPVWFCIKCAIDRIEVESDFDPLDFSADTCPD